MGSRNVAGGNKIASRGNSAPTVNDAADAAAACRGWLNRLGQVVIRRRHGRPVASWAVNSAATCAAVCGETPLASYIAASSSNSAAGISRNSPRSRGEQRLLAASLTRPTHIRRAPSTPRRPPGPPAQRRIWDHAPWWPGDTEHNARDRHDSVVRAQHRRPKPVKPTGQSCAGGSTARRESRFRATPPGTPAGAEIAHRRPYTDTQPDPGPSR